jgi:hypothetical protein
VQKNEVKKMTFSQHFAVVVFCCLSSALICFHHSLPLGTATVYWFKMSTGKAGRPPGGSNKPGHGAGGSRPGAGRKPKNRPGADLAEGTTQASGAPSSGNLGSTSQASVPEIPSE